MTSSGERRWSRAIDAICLTATLLPFRDIMLSIPYLSLNVRKDILKVARTQCSVNANPFLYRSLPTMVDKAYRAKHFITTVGIRQHSTAKQTVIHFSEMCHLEPAKSAIVSVLARSAPIWLLSEDHIQKNRDDSWWKEINAATGSDRPQVLNYDVWFGDDPSATYGLSNFLGPNPLLNSEIRRRLHAWRDSLENTILLPQVTSVKSVSRLTAYNYAVSVSGGTDVEEYDPNVSVVDLEKYYADTGIEVGGPAELRQTWGFNDLTPRTYFAQGGTTYHGSKYIRVIANSLCNAFPGTNFRTRFSVHSVGLHGDMLAFTYDYSSFTSNFTELKYFLQALAKFTAGTIVNIVDSHKGLMSASLGDLITEYLDSCNDKPEFTVQRYLTAILEPFIHTRSGMLGVYGNIALSTALHGLHACQLCGSLDCLCVGDDVLGSAEIKDIAEFEGILEAIESLGIINRSKTKVWLKEDPLSVESFQNRWPFLKRPLERYSDILVHQSAFVLPVFGEHIPIPDNVHKEEEHRDLKAFYSRLGVQCRTLVRQIANFSPTEEQRYDLQSYMAMLYGELELPEDGIAPWAVYTGRYKRRRVDMRNWLLPSLAAYMTGNEWETFGEEFEAGAYGVPDGSVQDGPQDYTSIQRLGEYEGTIGPIITYGVKMGWLESRQLYRAQYFETLSQYQEYFYAVKSRTLKVKYHVVAKRVPDWFYDLLRLVSGDETIADN